MDLNAENMPEGEPFVVGIDLGGTGSRFVSMSTSGVVLATRQVSTPTHQTPDLHASFFRENIAHLGSGVHPVAIGIGASGPIDSAGIIRNPDTLLAFSGFDLVGALARVFNAPCIIDNDAVTAALAEATFGAARGVNSLLHVTLGTGIGTCLLQDGKPFRGADGQHPEGGHLSVSGTPAPCYCGRNACWEQKASRGALQAAASLAMGTSFGDLRDVEEAARQWEQGSAKALALFTEYGRAVGEGLATLLGLYRPSHVIIGGSGSQFFSYYEDSMRHTVSETSKWHPPHTIGPTELDDFGGAIGAAVLALKSIGR